MTTTLMGRIEAAVELLDKRKPSWRNKIDLDKLDMANNSFCVLGEVYGDYRVGLWRLFSRERRAERSLYRLAGEFALDINDSTRSYKTLNRYWKKALRERGVG